KSCRFFGLGRAELKLYTLSSYLRERVLLHSGRTDYPPVTHWSGAAVRCIAWLGALRGFTRAYFRRQSLPRSPRAKSRYFTFAIFTILPFACESFGSFTTVTYNSFSPSPNATFVVPSPAAISNTCRSLPSGDIFKILPPNHWAT